MQVVNREFVVQVILSVLAFVALYRGLSMAVTPWEACTWAAGMVYMIWKF